MTILYNREGMKDTRRQLRREDTEAEQILWQALRGRQLENRKFRRQYSVGYYVLDFYCVEERLAIELDGSVHNSVVARQHDAYRTEDLNGVEIKVIRFRNDEVSNELKEVLIRIKQFFKQ